MRNTKSVVISALGYLLVTFPVAILWHLVLLKDAYEAIGYIGRDEPIFLFGFLAILIQGFIMSAAFPIFVRGNYSVSAGLRYSLLIGCFFWTSHVLAFAAKSDVQRLDLFLSLETLYLVIQFGVYGLILGWSFRKWGLESATYA